MNENNNDVEPSCSFWKKVWPQTYCKSTPCNHLKCVSMLKPVECWDVCFSVK